MRSPSRPAPRSRSFTRRTATAPIPVCTWRSGPWPCRTRRSRPSGSCTPFIVARNVSASASTAWVSRRRAPLRRMAVSGSSIVSGWRRGMTVVLLIVAYRSSGRFWQARHPPRYAALLRLPSPSFQHSSGRRALRHLVWTFSTPAGFGGTVRIREAFGLPPLGSSALPLSLVGLEHRRDGRCPGAAWRRGGVLRPWARLRP